jgi:hypothetical protein
MVAAVVRTPATNWSAWQRNFSRVSKEISEERHGVFIGAQKRVKIATKSADFCGLWIRNGTVFFPDSWHELDDDMWAIGVRKKI